jgi:hypothetical protein
MYRLKCAQLLGVLLKSKVQAQIKRRLWGYGPGALASFNKKVKPLVSLLLLSLWHGQQCRFIGCHFHGNASTSTTMRRQHC